MAIPYSRATFLAYCLRQLGAPVVKINGDPDQWEDAIDNALQYMYAFNHDFLVRTYLKYTVTATDMTNGYIPINSDITGVVRILPFNGTNAGSSANLFSADYQIRLSDIYDLQASTTGGNFNMISYSMTKDNLAFLDFQLNSMPRIEFTRHTDRIYISNWEDISVGTIFIIEAFAPLDGTTFPKIWNDMMLKKLAVALIKKQWAINLKKFSGVPLPGGLTVNGTELYAEAISEQQAIEEEIRSVYEPPTDFFVG